MLEVLDIQFKEALRYGMTYEQYWFDDPQIYYIYEEIYLDKLKERDMFNWQLGQYIQFAVGSCLEKNIKYPEKPMFYAKQDKQKTVYDMLEQFKGMVAQVNKNFN